MANSMSASPGGPFRIVLDLESTLTPGFTFYAEYDGPVEDATDFGDSKMTIRTDEVGHHPTQGLRVFIDGKVPASAPLGTYLLSVFEQRLKVGNAVRKREIQASELPEQYRSLTIQQTAPVIEDFSNWPKIKKLGA